MARYAKTRYANRYVVIHWNAYGEWGNGEVVFSGRACYGQAISCRDRYRRGGENAVMVLQGRQETPRLFDPWQDVKIIEDEHPGRKRKKPRHPLYPVPAG